MKEFVWKVNEPSASVAGLAAELRLPPLLVACLLNRGCANAAAAQHYLEPRLAHLQDPFALPNMAVAVDRLLRAHREKEPIVVFGDYDVDGVTSTAILTEFFQKLGWQSVYYLPHRLEEGYGLSREAVLKCMERYPAKLWLAVDCGSTSFAVIQDLSERGIEVIVLDHHQVSDPLPSAHAIVNPQLGSDMGARSLCSAGLAFKLVHALLKRGRDLGWPEAHSFDIRHSLELVALGTIADIVPLCGENRILVRAGLDRLRTTSRPGLIALKEVAGISGSVSCHEVGFQLAPRLNAAGRLETALDALELLMAADHDRARAIATALDQQNRDRQNLERKITEEVLAAVQARFNPETDFAIVEGHPTWHVGVVGIVASRVLREFHRPVVILGSDGSDHWRGSGRSIKSFDLAAGLKNCADLLLKCGGHAMAAGLTMHSARFAQFRERLNEIVRSSLQPEQLHPELELDSEVRLEELTFPTLKALDRLQPVGHGNPPVQLVARGLTLRGEKRPVGNAQQHVRFNVTDGTATHQALWWNCPASIEIPPRFDLAFAPELNEFNGTYAIQLKVLDLKPAKPASSSS